MRISKQEMLLFIEKFNKDIAKRKTLKSKLKEYQEHPRKYKDAIKSTEGTLDRLNNKIKSNRELMKKYVEILNSPKQTKTIKEEQVKQKPVKVKTVDNSKITTEKDFINDAKEIINTLPKEYKDLEPKVFEKLSNGMIIYVPTANEYLDSKVRKIISKVFDIQKDKTLNVKDVKILNREEFMI